MTRRILIGTDSTADIPADLAESLGIFVLPIPMLVGEKEFLDGVDMTPQQVYSMLHTLDKLPTTSAITPYTFYDLYKEKFAEGWTDFIYVPLNSNGSSTYSNALSARGDFYRKHPEAESKFHIHLPDARNYTMGYGWGVVTGARMAKEGKSPEEILAAMQDWFDHARTVFIPMEMTYIRKSGRVSPGVAIIGNVLGIKPIIAFEDGKPVTLATVRGEKKAIPHLLEIVNQERKPDTPYLLIRAENDEAIAHLEEACAAQMDRKPEMTYYVGGIISTHTGPNMIGIIYRT